MFLKTPVRAIALCLPFLCFFSSALAQKAPMKWGKVDAADLQMTSYAADTAAEALVLADFGSVQFDFASGARIILEHHKRIKILKRSGFGYADISLPFYHEDRLEDINSIKAQVIAPDGEITTLSKSDITTEKIDENWSQIKFSFPGIEEGTIIEYRYKKYSKLVQELPEWYFQEKIPVRWSEYRLNIPEQLRYVSLTQGRRLDINEQSGNEFRMVMKDVPALRPEPYITTMDDYLARIRFQLSGTYFEAYKPFLTSWENVAKDLLESEKFGLQFNQKRFHNGITKAAASVIKEGMSDHEKLHALYNFVNREMEWNEYYGVYASEYLDRCFEKKSGSKAEMNMMLLALLRANGFKAWPVLISTRSNGRPVDMYPILDQFNGLIVLAELDGKPIWLDTGNPNRHPGILSVATLNKAGFMVDEEHSQWVELEVPESRMAYIADLQLQENGSMAGNVISLYSGYNSASVKARKGTQEDFKYFQDWLQGVYPEAEMSRVEYNVKGKFKEKLEAKMDCDIQGSVMGFEDRLYVTPILFPIFNEHPLKLDRRDFPVDFPYPFMEQFMIKLQIPEGYEIEDIPETKVVQLPADGGRMKFVVSQIDEGKLQIICQFKISQLHYGPDEYHHIKELFDQLMEAQESQIVLRKKRT